MICLIFVKKIFVDIVTYFYHLIVLQFCFLYLFGSALLIGAVMGSGFAGQTKHWSLQVIAYSLTIFGALSWWLPSCGPL
jgi:predicted tellurium resistance membrane protein TerC